MYWLHGYLMAGNRICLSAGVIQPAADASHRSRRDRHVGRMAEKPVFTGRCPCRCGPVPQTEPGQTAQQLCSNAGDNELTMRLNRSFGPIAAGLIIDLFDFSTFGPIGLVLGLPVGGLSGYWTGRALGLDKRASVWCAICAAIYCTIPGTEFIPLATIIGAYVRFRQSGKGS